MLNIGGKDAVADVRLDAWATDPTIYDEIDDQLSVLELRPYYYQLGLARVDSSQPSVYDDPEDGLTASFDIHLDPAAHRGKIYKLDGIVWDAWTDQMVARDRPYDIREVHRIRFFKRLFNVEHDEVDKLGRVTKTRRSTWHAYEVAALPAPGQQLPKRGHTISFTGRFLKVRGYPVEKHPMLDMQLNIRRQSDKAWFKLFTTFAYVSEPPPAPLNFRTLGWSALVLGISFIMHGHPDGPGGCRS